MDHSMGRVLSAIDRNGYTDNTIIICTTDHGIAFPHMKCRLTDHGTGVMLIMRGPGGFTGGKVVDSLVSQIDLFPTVCELTSLKKPSWLQGHSVVPIVNGNYAEEREAIFAETNYHATEEPMRSVRTKRWKYIRCFAEKKTTILPNIDAGLSKVLLYDNGLAERTHSSQLLFDLFYDPQETHNLAMDPEHRNTLSQMSERLEEWMRETNDPLLNGGLPVTDRMLTVDTDAYAPSGCLDDEREKLPWSNWLRNNSPHFHLREHTPPATAKEKS